MLPATANPDQASGVLALIQGLPFFAFAVFLVINPRNYAVSAFGAFLKMIPGPYRLRAGREPKPLPSEDSRRRICRVVGTFLIALFLITLIAVIALLVS